MNKIAGAHRSEQYEKITLNDYAESNELGVSPEEYRDAVYKVFEKMREKLVEGNKVVLPNKMGSLKIMGQVKEIKQNKYGGYPLPIDWPATRKMMAESPEAAKELVYMLNEHTDNVVYGVRWITNGLLLKNKLLYKTKIYRYLGTAIRDKILSGDYSYDLLYKSDGRYPKQHAWKKHEQAI